MLFDISAYNFLSWSILKKIIIRYTLNCHEKGSNAIRNSSELLLPDSFQGM